MSQTVNDREATSEILSALYLPIEEELAEVEQILRNELRSRFPFVDELVRYGCLLGGKRMRPALLLLTAKATGNLRREHAVLAAVVEMIHTATLVHDDVLDEAVQRRHLATVNSRWNNEASVLLGDYLFTHAFYLASTLESTFACRLIGRATNTVCEGELRQIATRGNYLLDEEQYLQIIEAKTAELVACCCRIGAHYAGASGDTVERLTRYGRDLGIAFQIADDLLDVVGDEATTGKSLGTDLDLQKPTLPVIRALQLATADEREDLLNVLAASGDERKAALNLWFDRFDALSYARSRACWYAERARLELATLPPSPAQQTLLLLAEFVVSRSQ